MTELTVREKVMKAELQNIACGLGLDHETAGFLEIVNAIFALKHPWIDTDGVDGMPIGHWIVLMEDGDYGVCEIAQGAQSRFGVINGRFYFDLSPVIAYMPMPEYMPKGG